MKKILFSLILFFPLFSVTGQTLLPDSAILRTLEGKNTNKQVFQYDVKGNVSANIYYTWDDKSGKWKDYMLFEYEQDDNGNPIAEIAFQSDEVSGDWFGIYQRFSEYDRYGNEVLTEVNAWDKETGRWVPNSKSECEYDTDNSKVSEVSYFGNESDWVKYADCVYRYELDVNKDVFSSVKYNQYWLDEEIYERPAIKYAYKYEDDNLVSTIYYSWNIDEASWLEKNKYEYEYDTNDNQVLEVHSFWNEKRKAWQRHYKYGHIYNDEGKLTEMFLYLWDMDSNNWKGKYKYEYEYDAAGNPTIINLYEWEDNDWLFNEIGTYYYSDHPVVGGDDDVSGGLSVNVYPNPTINYITIAEAEGMDLVIVDAQGRMIYTKKNIGEQETVQTASWTSGMYFVTLQAGENRITKKIIKR